MPYSIGILPCDVGPAGGFVLTLFFDGVEVGAGVFPADAGILDVQRELLAYQEALAAGDDWLSARLVC